MQLRFAFALFLLAAPLSAQAARPAAVSAAIPARREFAHQRNIRMEFHAPSGWTIVELEPMELDVSGRTALRTSFRFPGHEPANAPASLTFAIVGRGLDEVFATPPVLSLVLDGKAPIVVASTRFARAVTADTTETTVYATMPRATFLRFTSASSAEVHVDDRAWTLAPEMMEGLRDLASRMSPQGYRAAKSELGMVTAAEETPSTGATRIYAASEVDAMVKPRGMLKRPLFPVDAPAVKRRVYFRYVVDTTGTVDVSTLRGEAPKPDSLFVESLRSAAAKWLFVPAKKDGHLVRVEVRQVFEFEPGK